jgi:hypothetical protein
LILFSSCGLYSEIDILEILILSHLLYDRLVKSLEIGRIGKLFRRYLKGRG